MAKSTALNFTQNINNVYVEFFSSEKSRVIAVSTLSPGTGNTNLNALPVGIRTFTAAAGTVQPGTNAASWTANVFSVGADNRVIGQPIIINGGDYLVSPTITANPATPDSGNSNVTWNLRVENYKELYTAPINDAVVKAINVTSLDSAARVMSLWFIGDDAQPVLLGAVSIPLRSGDNGTAAAIDLLNGTLMPSLTYDANGKRIIPLKAGQKIAVSVPAVSNGTQINVIATIEEY